MTDATDNNATAADNQQPTSGGATGSVTPEPKFTQADIDRIDAKTRKEARAAAVNDLLKELGFDKADDLKAVVQSAKAKAEADLSAAEKSEAARLKAEKERDEAKTALESEKAARLIDKRNDALMAAAAKAGALDAKDVLRWAGDESADALKATLKDDGALDDKAVDALVAAAKKAKPHYFGVGAPGSPSLSGGKPAGTDKKGIREAVFGGKSSVHL